MSSLRSLIRLISREMRPSTRLPGPGARLHGALRRASTYYNSDVAGLTEEQVEVRGVQGKTCSDSFCGE